ncbi:MAG: hypothetical protein ACE5E9_12585 [Nitrospinaceae bacterium]
MAIATTVEARIVAGFVDRFTGPSQKAFEVFRKNGDAAFKAVSASGVAAFQKIRAAQKAAFDLMKEVERLSKPAGSLRPLSGGNSGSEGLNLEPQFGRSRTSIFNAPPLPSFAGGIRFVPRDMIAGIHEGEAVLPRREAGLFRQGRLGGGDHIEFHINGGLVPDRNTARRFARMIEDERVRLNLRRSP